MICYEHDMAKKKKNKNQAPPLMGDGLFELNLIIQLALGGFYFHYL